eukprot:symbB.v1.2.025096.t1/scaffold2416.1/size79758/2
MGFQTAPVAGPRRCCGHLGSFRLQQVGASCGFGLAKKRWSERFRRFFALISVKKTYEINGAFVKQATTRFCRISYGVFTIRTKVGGASLPGLPPDPRNISFYELDDAGKIVYVRDIPESVTKPPPLQALAAMLQPQLRIFATRSSAVGGEPADNTRGLFRLLVKPLKPGFLRDLMALQLRVTLVRSYQILPREGPSPEWIDFRNAQSEARKDREIPKKKCEIGVLCSE